MKVACLFFFVFWELTNEKIPAFIYQYKKMKFNQNLPSKKNLMVIHLFVKKAVPLYIKEKEILTTKKTLQLWQRQKKKQTLRC